MVTSRGPVTESCNALAPSRRVELERLWNGGLLVLYLNDLPVRTRGVETERDSP